MKKIMLIMVLMIILLAFNVSAYNYSWPLGTDGDISNEVADYWAYMSDENDETITKGTFTSPSGAPVFDNVSGIWCLGTGGVQDYFIQTNSSIPGEGNDSVISFMVDLYNVTGSTSDIVFKVAYDRGGSEAVGLTWNVWGQASDSLEFYDGLSDKIPWKTANDTWKFGKTGINITVIGTHNGSSDLARMRAYITENGALINDTGWFDERQSGEGDDWEINGGTQAVDRLCMGNLRTYIGVQYPQAPLEPPNTPVLTAPDNTTVWNFNVTLQYSAANADSYYVYHGTNNPPQTIVCHNTSATSCQVNATSGEDTYYWYVVAQNEDGNSSNSSIRQWGFDITNVIVQAVGDLSGNASITNTDFPIHIRFMNSNLDDTIVNVTAPSGRIVFLNLTNNLGVNEYNVTTTLFLNETGIHLVNAWGDDRASNVGIGNWQFTFDNSTPQFGNVTNNGSNSTTGEKVTFFVEINDTGTLSSYIFSNNQTGNFTNGTVQTITGSAQNITGNVTITAVIEDTICGLFYGNDTAGNSAESVQSCFTVFIPVVPPQTAGFPFISIVMVIIMGFVVVKIIKLIFTSDKKSKNFVLSILAVLISLVILFIFLDTIIVFIQSSVNALS